MERAFRIFDLDGDGYLSWDEFSKIGLSPGQARRIFTFCCKDAAGRINQEQFCNLASWRPAHIEMEETAA